MKTIILTPLIFILLSVSTSFSQEVVHLSSAAIEDNNPIYDANTKDPKTVEWIGGTKHNVGYYSYQGYTLIIKGIELKGNFILDGVDTSSTLIIEDCIIGGDGSDYEFLNVSGTWDCKSSIRNATLNNFPGCKNFGHCDIIESKFYFQRGAKLIISDYQNIKNLHSAVPLIMNNEFHSTDQYDVLDIRGANAEIIGNKFIYSDMSGRADQSIQMGYLSDQASPTPGWYPRSGKTIIKNNESMGSFEILTKQAYQPVYEAIDQFTLEIEIIDNVFMPAYGGTGGGPAEVPVFANIRIQNNTFIGRGMALYTVGQQNEPSIYMEPHKSFLINNNVFKNGIGDWSGGTAVEYGYPTNTWINAENNNWGHISGPANESSRDGDTNNGKGMGVGDYIDYRPFVGIPADTEIDMNLRVGILNPEDQPPFTENQEVGFSPEIEYNLKSGEGNIHLDVYTNYGDPVVSNLPFIIAENGEHTAKFENLIIKIPEGIDELIFQAVMHPKTGTFSYSNKVDFDVHHPGAKLITTVTGIDHEEDDILINGQHHVVHLNVKYKSERSGSLTFTATERNSESPKINKTELHLHSDPIDASSGNLWAEKEDITIEFTLPLRGVDGPSSEVLIETVLQTEDLTIKDEIILKVHEVKDEITLGLKLKGNPEGLPNWRPLDHLRTGEHFYLGFQVKANISHENSTLWKLRTKLTTKDQYGNIINDTYCHEQGSSEIYKWDITEEVNIHFKSETPVPENTVEGELVIELVNENGIVMKHIKEPIAIRNASKKVQIPAPEGDISLDFAPVSLKLDIDGNTNPGNVTAYEYEHPHEIEGLESLKSGDYSITYINRFWETFSDLEDYSDASVEITLNPDTDFPEEFVYDGDSIAIAVWDTVARDYVFIPTAFNDFVLKAVIENINTTYLVAVFNQSTSIDNEYFVSTKGSFELLQNFPNPVGDHTWIRFNLNEPSEVECTIYNINGKKVWSSPGKWFSTGQRGIMFIRKDLLAGIYIYQLTIGHENRAGRMVLK